MDISRRLFLGGVLSVAAISVVPAEAIAALGDVPVLYADGQHDDTAALNALFSGQPVRVAHESEFFWDGENVHQFIIATGSEGSAVLRNGRFLISDTIHIEVANAAVRDCEFIMTGAGDYNGIEAHGFCRIYMHTVTLRREPHWVQTDDYSYGVPVTNAHTYQTAHVAESDDRIGALPLDWDMLPEWRWHREVLGI